MAEPPAPPPSKDTLGLDLDSLKITEDTPAPAPPPDAAAADQEQPAATPITPSQSQQSDVTAGGTPVRERKKPYINPERVKTGGAQRDKLTDEELAERMVRIREQNEKIKQRRADVDEDEREFKRTQEAERAKQAKNKKVQENVDRAREQNARRKMDKIQNREWDSGKPGVKKTTPDVEVSPTHAPPTQGASINIRGAVRGGGGGRGRGRGRGGGGGPSGPAPSSEGAKPAGETPAPAPTPASAPAPAPAAAPSS